MNNGFVIGQWYVNPSEGTISSDSETKHLEPKALSVLLVLAKSGDKVVSQEQFFEQVWPNQAVVNEVLSSNIARLRKALGDDRKTNTYIKTVPKKGYKLIKSVIWSEPNTAINKHKAGTLNNGQNSTYKLRRRQVYSLIVLSLLTYMLFIWQQQNKEPSLDGNDMATIAVLPFNQTGNDSNLMHFSDGFAEEIIHQLSTNAKLRVIARSASFQYRDTDKTSPEIASELNVKYLIEGNIRENENGLRIGVQLIDAKNNYLLWSRVFDESTEDIYKIQQLVSIAVRDLLNLNVNSLNTTTRIHPESKEAYKLFIMAQAYMKIATVDSYETALELLQKAIIISPDYALAYSNQALCTLLLYQYKHLDRDSAISKTKSLLNHALKLQSDLPEVYVVNGLMYTYLKKYDKAEYNFRQALDLIPNSYSANHNFAFLLWQQSRFKEAIKYGELALATAPISKQTHFLLSDSLASLAEFEQAESQYMHCINVVSDYPACYAGLGNMYMIIAELDKASYYMDKSASVCEPDNFWHNITYSSLLIHRGEYNEAEQLLENVRNKIPTDYFLLRTQWLAAVSLEQTEQYFKLIDELTLQHPNDIDLKKFRALKAFWTRDFHQAIKLYEQINLEAPQFMNSVWDYADGLSHATILAMSYDKIGDGEKKQHTMMLVEQHLSSLPEGFDRVQGGKYIRAQYAAISGDINQANILLQELEQDWNLNWLIRKDPFWTYISES